MSTFRFLPQIAFGEHHAMVLTEKGKLFAFGVGKNQELGLGKAVDRVETPTLVPDLPPIEQVP